MTVERALAILVLVIALILILNHLQAPVLEAAVIGLGQMGCHHARILQNMQGVWLAAAVDPAGDTHNAAPGVPIYPSIATMLHRHHPDMAVVAVPSTGHATTVDRLALAGIHVLIEKPLAHSIEDAQRIIDTVKRGGIHAAVGHIERFNPAISALRAHLPAIGEVLMVETRRSGPSPGRQMEVGVTMDLATHDLDLIAWLTGPIDTLNAETIGYPQQPHESLALITGRTSSGDLFHCQADWCSPAKTRRVCILGEHGSLTACTVGPRLTLHKHDRPPVDYLLPKVEPLRAELDAFTHLVRTGEHGDLATLEDGLAAVQHATTALQGTHAPRPLEIAA